MSFFHGLLKFFFVILIELKNGDLTEEILNSLKYPNYLLERDECKEYKNKLDSLFKKYNLSVRDILFDLGDWEKFLIKGDVSQINEMIQDLHFFIEEEKQEEISSWRKLLNFRELEEEDFNKYLEDVIGKFQENKYTELHVLFYVINILIDLYEMNVSDYSLESIKKQALKLLDELLNSNNIIRLSFRVNHNHDLSYDIYKEFESKIFEHNKKINEEKSNKSLENLIEIIKQNNKGKISEFLLEKKTVFLDKKYSKQFVQTIIGSNNKIISDFLHLIQIRYEKTGFRDELDFWKEVQKELSNQPVDLRDRKVKQFNLNRFKEKVTEIVDKMQNHNQ